LLGVLDGVDTVEIIYYEEEEAVILLKKKFLCHKMSTGKAE